MGESCHIHCGYFLSVFIFIIMVNTSRFNLMHIQHLLVNKTKRTVSHYGPQIQLLLGDTLAIVG